jgi:hypothetical protein
VAIDRPETAADASAPLEERLLAACLAWQDPARRPQAVADATDAVRQHFCRDGERPQLPLVRAAMEFVTSSRVAGTDPGDAVVLSSLDTANLRLLAAAGPLLDQNHLTTLLRSIPRTGFPLRVAQPDVAATRAELQEVLAPYDSARRTRLLRSLIVDATTRDLDLSPPERVREAPGALALVHGALRRDLTKGRRQRQFAALGNEHLDGTLLPLALDVLEPLQDQLTPEGIRRTLERFANHDLQGATVVEVDRMLRLLHASGRSFGASDNVCSALASNPTAGRSVLHALARRGLPGDPFAYARSHDHDLYAQRAMVAANPATEPDTLQLLSRDPDTYVRGAVLANPCTPPAVVEQLRRQPNLRLLDANYTASLGPSELRADARDWSPNVRRRAARHPATPGDVLAMLTNDQDGRVAVSATANPSTPADALVAVLDRPGPFYLEAALQNPSFPEHALLAIARGADKRRKLAIAGNAQLPADARTALLTDPDASVRARIAERTDLPLSSFAMLANDPDDVVLDALAANPALDTAVGRSLWQRDMPIVRAALLHNPAMCAALPDDALHDIDPHLARRIASSGDMNEGPAVAAIATDRLGDSAKALASGVAAPTAAPKLWSDLPSSKDVPFPLPVDPAFVEDHPVAGLTGRVARTSRDLDHLHDQMGNCLDTYAAAARKGQVLIASFDDPDEHDMYAAAWDVSADGRLSLREVNAKYNRSVNVPDRLRSGLRELTDRHNETVRLPSAPHHRRHGVRRRIGAPLVEAVPDPVVQRRVAPPAHDVIPVDGVAEHEAVQARPPAQPPAPGLGI